MNSTPFSDKTNSQPENHLDEQHLKAELMRQKKVIEANLENFYALGTALITINDQKLYRGGDYTSFEDFCKKDLRRDISKPRIHQLMKAALVVNNLRNMGLAPKDFPKREAYVRPLTTLSADEQHLVWKAVLKSSPDVISANLVKKTIAQLGLGAPHPAESVNALPEGMHMLLPKEALTDSVEVTGVIDDDTVLVDLTDETFGLSSAVLKTASAGDKASAMKRARKLRDMAGWVWNPVASSLKDVGDETFQPTAAMPDRVVFIPSRLHQPQATTNPETGYVFVCPSVDLFNPMIPNSVILAVLVAIEEAKGQTFFVLTKNAERLANLPLPENLFPGVVTESAECVAQTEALLRNHEVNQAWLYVPDATYMPALTPTTPFKGVVIDAPEEIDTIPFASAEEILELWQECGLRVHCRKPLHLGWNEQPRTSQAVTDRTPEDVTSEDNNASTDTAPSNDSLEGPSPDKTPVKPASQPLAQRSWRDRMGLVPMMRS